MLLSESDDNEARACRTISVITLQSSLPSFLAVTKCVTTRGGSWGYDLPTDGQDGITALCAALAVPSAALG